MGIEIILGAPNGTPCDVGEMETRFSLFGDHVNLDA
jgi:hypothetical protein